MKAQRRLFFGTLQRLSQHFSVYFWPGPLLTEGQSGKYSDVPQCTTGSAYFLTILLFDDILTKAEGLFKVIREIMEMIIW